MTGSAEDGPDWQPHIRTKDKRRKLANRFGAAVTRRASTLTSTAGRSAFWSAQNLRGDRARSYEAVPQSSRLLITA